MSALQSPQAMAEQINAILHLDAPVPGTPSNGWFGGYGCRWCSYSLAWFTVVPFGVLSCADRVAELFRAGGASSVTITNMGGVSEQAGGRGLQVSAYV